MCTRAGARSVATMSIRLIPLAAAAALAATASPARAANPVYGGSTRDDEPIVITANKAGKKLASAVVAWSASCDDGKSYFGARELTPAADEPGFSPGPSDLVMTRNAKGRFAGTTMAGQDLGEAVGI